MRLRELKQMLDKLPEDKLDQELLYASAEHCLSGVVKSVCMAKETLYSAADDSASFYTKRQLKDKLCMDAEEIDNCGIEIPKGAFVVLV